MESSTLVIYTGQSSTQCFELIRFEIGWLTMQLQLLLIILRSSINKWLQRCWGQGCRGWGGRESKDEKVGLTIRASGCLNLITLPSYATWNEILHRLVPQALVVSHIITGVLVVIVLVLVPTPILWKRWWHVSIDNNTALVVVVDTTAYITFKCRSVNYGGPMVIVSIRDAIFNILTNKLRICWRKRYTVELELFKNLNCLFF